MNQQYEQSSPSMNGKDSDSSSDTHFTNLIKQSTFKLFKCIVQPKRQKDKGELKDEKEAIARRSFKCPNCDKTYHNVTRLMVHVRTHTGEKPFDCSFCHKKFNEKGSLVVHMRTHTGQRPYSCDVPNCEMKFKTKGQLNDHIRMHMNSRPFKCDLCAAAFNRKTRMKIHMMIHTGEKPYKCEYSGCNRRFREKGNLNAHNKVHTKKRCLEKSSQKCIVSNHVELSYDKPKPAKVSTIESLLEKLCHNENLGLNQYCREMNQITGESKYDLKFDF